MDENNVEAKSHSEGSKGQGLDENKVDAEAKPEGAQLPPAAAVDETNSGNSEADDTEMEGKGEIGDETELGDQNIHKSDSKDAILDVKEESCINQNEEDVNLAVGEALMDTEAVDDDTEGEALNENAQPLDESLPNEDKRGEMQDEAHESENEIPQNGNEMMTVEKPKAEDKSASAVVMDDKEARLDGTSETEGKVNSVPTMLHEPVTPHALVKYSAAKSGQVSGDTFKNKFDFVKMDVDVDEIEDQELFMREVEAFYRERALEFKPPKFYGQPLNCLKLWRAVIKLGGYDTVTGSKLWRQVGESFNPPKTCTTVSWTFRIFYEKALLEYERHKTQTGELQFSIVSLPDPSGVDNEGNGHQTPGSGRARRDAAARAMQGWHDQRHIKYSEGDEPIVKDKNPSSTTKREKSLKSIGSLKQKRPNEVELPVKAARTETSRQLDTTIVDVGPPADWVKINVREAKDCFEVYALVPGLLREEVRVQSDPAGRLVITGQPEQLDNPWGITAFKKVVSLPARIDPLQTSAVVSLHGRLFVRVPLEQPNL
ncbi:unnamed protein product [Cuscuta campestris]|uniref:ARID domain-containing protein n=1 Tax=Cuscuta campestris TaxID=132261 RepID=A0A484MJ39_9ASTE|nr:unnamed protein product [Cuscuta campestris]